MEFIRYISVIVAAVALTGCGYDRFGEPAPEHTAEYPVPNIGIGDVRRMCGDGVYHVTSPMVIGGYVTANDKSGNIYRSFFIEDGSGAVEIRAGMYSLHNVFTRGRYVTVSLEGLSVALYNGVLQVGLPPSEGYASVGYLDSWVLAAGYVFPTGILSGVDPAPVTVAELTEETCGRLVRLGGLDYYEDEEDLPGEVPDPGGENITGYEAPSWAYPRDGENTLPQSAYRYFRDAAGNTVAVYTSGYASFAGRKIPPGKVTLTGIVSYGATDKGNMYILRFRDHEDVTLQVGD